MMDAGLETALVMYYPGRMDGGKVVNQLLCNVDLMPTLLEFIGVDVPQGIDGNSFLNLLKPAESNLPTRDHFFSELTWHDQYHPMRSVWTGKFKYIRNFEDGPSVYLPRDIHRSLSGVVVRDEYYAPNVPEELYDLEKDPIEKCNVTNLPEYAEVLIELRSKVDAWMSRTKDPLLKGSVSGIAAPDWQEQFDNSTAYSYKRKP
nr:sulfatase/phosphatase domain-containing protein [Paenibacillus sp. V4I7]